MTFEELLNQMNLRVKQLKKLEKWEIDFIVERTKELNIKIGFENLKLLFEIRKKIFKKRRK